MFTTTRTYIYIDCYNTSYSSSVGYWMRWDSQSNSKVRNKIQFAISKLWAFWLGRLLDPEPLDLIPRLPLPRCEISQRCEYAFNKWRRNTLANQRVITASIGEIKPVPVEQLWRASTAGQANHSFMQLASRQWSSSVNIPLGDRQWIAC